MIAKEKKIKMHDCFKQNRKRKYAVKKPSRNESFVIISSLITKKNVAKLNWSMLLPHVAMFIYPLFTAWHENTVYIRGEKKDQIRYGGQYRK